MSGRGHPYPAASGATAALGPMSAAFPTSAAIAGDGPGHVSATTASASSAAAAAAVSDVPGSGSGSGTVGPERHHGTLTDRLYNAELARRSVARAALHLGIDSMEGQALDCLGDALLDYLNRVSSVFGSFIIYYLFCFLFSHFLAGGVTHACVMELQI